MRLYWHLFPNFLVGFDSGKIEKEKKKVAQEAGFLRTEVTGGEVSDWNGKYFHGVKCGRFLLWLLEICWSYFCNGFNMVFFFLLKNQMAEETERERRIFQLQMCEVSSWCNNIHFIFNYYQYTRPNRESASSKHTLSGPQKTDSGLLMHYQPYSLHDDLKWLWIRHSLSLYY